MSLTPSSRLPGIAAPGQRLDVDGVRLHLQRSGPGRGLRAAGPTIVIEAAMACASPLYARLQRALAMDFDVCSYDRAGLGWSDAAPGPADAASAADRLHGLLAAAGVDGPLLLVGHSLGALIARVFARRYPRQVAGLVLLDGSHPGQRFDAAMCGWPKEYAIYLRQSLARYETTGEIPADIGQLMQVFADLPDIPPQIAALAGMRWVDAGMRESDSFAASAEQAELPGGLGDLPLAVLWAPVVASLPGLAAAQLFQRWRAFQADAAALSSRGRLLAVDGADHMGLVLDPRFAAIAVREIAALANEIRQSS